jgi:hypothetical protein
MKSILDILDEQLSEAVVYSENLRDMEKKLRIRLSKYLKKHKITNEQDLYETDIEEAIQNIILKLTGEYYPDIEVIFSVFLPAPGGTGYDKNGNLVVYFNLEKVVDELKQKTEFTIEEFMNYLVMCMIHEFTHVEESKKRKIAPTKDQLIRYQKKYLRNQSTYVKSPQEQKAYALDLIRNLKAAGYTKERALAYVSDESSRKSMWMNLGMSHFKHADRLSRNKFLRYAYDYINKVYGESNTNGLT